MTPPLIYEMDCQSIEEIQCMLKMLENREFEIEPITNGLTNKLFRATNQETLLVRIFGKETDLLIDRNREFQVIMELSDCRMGPKVYARFLNGMVYEYLPGQILKTSDMKIPKIYKKVARHIAKWHALDLNMEKSPILMPTIQTWMSIAQKMYSGSDLFDFEKLGLEIEFLEELFSEINSPVVFCHNDLQSGNILFDSGTNTLNFIDYEYAGYSYRGFDLANHFCEYAGPECDWDRFPEKSFILEWLHEYLSYNSTRSPKLDELDSIYNEIIAFSLASHFSWSIWAIIQYKISDIPYDYLEYAERRFKEYYKLKPKVLDMYNKKAE